MKTSDRYSDRLPPKSPYTSQSPLSQSGHSFFSLSLSWALLRANSCVRQHACRGQASRLLLSRFRPYPFGFPPIKQTLAWEAEASRFWVPQENGAEKGEMKCLT
jgi:hypothetical protein